MQDALHCTVKVAPTTCFGLPKNLHVAHFSPTMQSLNPLWFWRVKRRDLRYGVSPFLDHWCFAVRSLKRVCGSSKPAFPRAGHRPCVRTVGSCTQRRNEPCCLMLYFEYKCIYLQRLRWTNGKRGSLWVFYVKVPFMRQFMLPVAKPTMEQPPDLLIVGANKKAAHFVFRYIRGVDFKQNIVPA